MTVPPAERYFIVNKPYNMVSQFISSHPVGLLGDLCFDFPEGTHAIGRLDANSEGLLLLTTNKRVTRLLFQGDTPHKRRYLVQVNNIVNNDSLERLRSGVSIRISTSDYYTPPPCAVVRIEDPQKVYPFAINPTTIGDHTWLLITLTEGKFRQVRKMIMAINHRCKRLIRVSIEDLQLGTLEPGGVEEVTETTFLKNSTFNTRNKKVSRPSTGLLPECVVPLHYNQVSSKQQLTALVDTDLFISVVLIKQ